MNTGIMGKGMGYPIYIPSLETLEISMCKFKNGKWRWLLSYYYIIMNECHDNLKFLILQGDANYFELKRYGKNGG